jgi:hypothetical protein
MSDHKVYRAARIFAAHVRGPHSKRLTGRNRKSDPRGMALATVISAIAFSALDCMNASAQVPAAQREVVAATSYFRFHSDALYNLHDLLTWRTSGLPSAPSDSCARASPADWRAFVQAAQLYASKRGPQRNRFILAMRFEVAGYPGLRLQPGSVIAPALALLNAALPAYRACWWEEHNRRNRAWIAQLLPRLRPHEDSIGARLARLYQNDWEKPFPVDVVTFASSTGASTIVEPHHINISAEDSSYRGDAGVEMVFHEASHTILGSRRDVIQRTLSDSALIGTAQPPRDLGHALLFYTTGRVTQQRLAETGTTDYQPYMYKEGVLDRAWPELRAPMERHWQAYLEGKTSLVDALRAIVAAVPRARVPDQ